MDAAHDDRNDSGYQLSYATAKVGIDISLLLLEPIACKTFSSKGVLDAARWSSRSLCHETVTQLEQPVYHSGINFNRSSKPVNLPSSKKIKIDIEHILEGHITGGSRITNNSNKTIFPDNFSKNELEKCIRQAYKNGKRIKTQGNRALVLGEYNGAKIEMWVDLETRTIKTAYPQKPSIGSKK